MTYRRYTPAEDDTLRRVWADRMDLSAPRKVSLLARILHRTFRSVACRAKVIGLVRFTVSEPAVYTAPPRQSIAQWWADTTGQGKE